MRPFRSYPKQGLPIRLPKPLKKSSGITTDDVKYYKLAVAKNINENKGKCICKECGAQIINPTGRNVSHIVARGANPKLYHDITNHFILCFECEFTWTNGDRTTMKIYPESEKTREKLNYKYYTDEN